MKTAIISDIHANIEALEAVLADIAQQKCDRIFCLGDVVGYGPNPRKCVERLRELNVSTVKGNHDEACSSDEFPYRMNADAQAAAIWTQEQLSADDKAWLRNLPLMLAAGAMTFVHSSPANPENWNYVLWVWEAEKAFENFKGHLCFLGHSHQPLVWVETNRGLNNEEFDRVHFEKSKRYVINVGSVGQPRDDDPRAAYVVVDSKRAHCFLKRVAYDFKKTQRKIVAAGLPEKLADRLEEGW